MLEQNNPSDVISLVQKIKFLVDFWQSVCSKVAQKCGVIGI